ncbi:50S ribosomal protein L24 [Haladaptatus sp. F3-133]|jgi:large subunit ribosomal protein L24|uniref:Large ribosomal subunit protein uL24 n=1 Tax=Halorutilus salinus TaxID=2487751 RepID=A0A9Q4C3Z6_9EURY|nr:50S ribosomal protein L24 [Halorutilus salinus]MCX2818560.1 50S ribosomal protein L24 [Halorutilus salinus]
MTEKATQPRKQRKEREEAPLHRRNRFVRSTLSDDLREEYGTRSVRVSEGDTVEVLRGDDAGEEEEVLYVDLDETKVYVENVTVEKTDGEEVPRPIDASNLRVVDLNLDDPERVERLEEVDEE